jgi:hypothetical protein
MAIGQALLDAGEGAAHLREVCATGIYNVDSASLKP